MVDDKENSQEATRNPEGYWETNEQEKHQEAGLTTDSNPPPEPEKK